MRKCPHGVNYKIKFFTRPPLVWCKKCGSLWFNGEWIDPINVR